jgi:hypothetical protein
MTHEKAYDTAYDLYLNYMKQHVEGFNFFLVVSGLLINALIDVFDKGYSPVVLYLLCGFEAVVSLVFFLLDIRSTKYMKAAKAVLKRIEQEMCQQGDCSIGAVMANDLERKKLKANFRMTYVFWFVYGIFFFAAISLILIVLLGI